MELIRPFGMNALCINSLECGCSCDPRVVQDCSRHAPVERHFLQYESVDTAGHRLPGQCAAPICVGQHYARMKLLCAGVRDPARDQTRGGLRVRRAQRMGANLPCLLCVWSVANDARCHVCVARGRRILMGPCSCWSGMVYCCRCTITAACVSCISRCCVCYATAGPLIRTTRWWS